MRLNHVGVLVRMLLRYFTRRTLSLSALRQPGARIALVVLLAVGGLGLTAAAYLFLRHLLDDPSVLVLLLDVTSTSAVFWTLVLFVFVKVLFITSDGLLRFTYQLPVSNRERAAAMLAYESVMVLGSVSALFVPVAVAVLLIA